MPNLRSMEDLPHPWSMEALVALSDLRLVELLTTLSDLGSMDVLAALPNL